MLLVDLDRIGLCGITALPVPCFQPLLTLRGTLEQIAAQLPEAAAQGTPERPAWLEVQVVSDDYLSDLGTRLADLTRELPVEVLRKGATKTLTITLGEMPNDTEIAAGAGKLPAKPEVNRIGLLLKELTPQQKKKLNGKNGLLVVDSQGAAAQAGLRRGDVILGLNNSEVESLDQFNKQIAAAPSGKTVALLVQRGENTLYVPVKVGNGK